MNPMKHRSILRCSIFQAFSTQFCGLPLLPRNALQRLPRLLTSTSRHNPAHRRFGNTQQLIQGPRFKSSKSYPAGHRLRNAFRSPKVHLYIKLGVYAWIILWIGYSLTFVEAEGDFQRYWTLAGPPPSKKLNPGYFTKYKLVAREAVSSTSSIFTFQAIYKTQKSHEETWKSGVWSVEIKQPQLQIARSYTPLPPVIEPGSGDSSGSQLNRHTLGEIRILVRQEPQGEVSGYLHGMALGEIVEFRGPHVEWDMPEKLDKVLFVAGGTGIAPALQVAYALSLRKSRNFEVPWMHILWANRRREDCLGGNNDTQSAAPTTDIRGPLVKYIDAMAQSESLQLTTDFFVDEEQSFVRIADIAKLLTPAHMGDEISDGEKMILVSGPEGFVSYMAGPKTLPSGMESQGTLRGLLAEIDLTDWHVWKL